MNSAQRFPVVVGKPPTLEVSERAGFDAFGKSKLAMELLVMIVLFVIPDDLELAQEVKVELVPTVEVEGADLIEHTIRGRIKRDRDEVFEYLPDINQRSRRRGSMPRATSIS